MPPSREVPQKHFYSSKENLIQIRQSQQHPQQPFKKPLQNWEANAQQPCLHPSTKIRHQKATPLPKQLVQKDTQQPEPLWSSVQSKVIYKTPNILYIWLASISDQTTTLQCKTHSLQHSCHFDYSRRSLFSANHSFCLKQTSFLRCKLQSGEELSSLLYAIVSDQLVGKLFPDT